MKKKMNKILIAIVTVVMIITVGKINTSNTVKAATGGVGYTITQTFPDATLASHVANRLGKTINDVITQSDIDSQTSWAFYNISDMTGIEYFVNLTTLNVAGITNIPDEIGNLNKLNNLSIAGTYTSIPASIWNLSTIETFHIESPQLTSIPDEISNLSNLKTLSFNGNFTSLPASIGDFAKLESLSIYSEALTTLPASIGNLSELLGLSFMGGLTSLPESIGNLNKLQSMFFDGCKITTLPESIGNLTNLNNLNLSQLSQLTSLPESIGNLTNLMHFNITQAPQLTSLPDSIGNLSNLNGLMIDSTGITALPNTIGNLSSLQFLTISMSQLTTLPDSIGDLPKVTSINAYANKITSLPASLGKLGDREGSMMYTYINVDMNCIATLPRSLVEDLASKRMHLSAGMQQITLPPIVWSDPLNVPTALGYEGIDSEAVITDQISDSGTYSNNVITWTGLEEKPQDLSYYFRTEGLLNEYGYRMMLISGTVTQPVVLPTSVKTLDVEPVSDVAYNGLAHTPSIVIKDGTKTLVEGVDYTLSYSDNVNIGTAKINVTGIGFYKETREITFNITESGLAVEKAPTSSIKKGETLSTATISGGVIVNQSGNQVDGVFTWVNPNQAITETGMYEVLFTPTDSNYKPLTILVYVEVNNEETVINPDTTNNKPNDNTNIITGDATNILGFMTILGISLVGLVKSRKSYTER